MPMICSAEMLAAIRENVGRDQRGADGPPGQRPAGQEIILGVLLVAGLFPGNPLRQNQQENAVYEHNGIVEALQVHVSRFASVYRAVTPIVATPRCG